MSFITSTPVPPAGAAGQVLTSDGAVWVNAAPASSSYSNSKFFLSSGTFVAPITGTYCVTVIGAGGSGGASDTGFIVANATGGGAGAFQRKIFNASSGQNFSVIVGAGGPGVTGPNNGNAGGASSFIGNGLNIVSNGGQGGTYSHFDILLPGALGGSGLGGDYGYTGGGSGYCLNNGVNPAEAACATGGGAVNFGFGPFSSGNATNSANGGLVGGSSVATGGAGTGGNSASVIMPSNVGGYWLSGGGGSNGPSAVGLANTINAGGIGLGSAIFTWLNSAGSNSGTSSTGTPTLNGGGGSGACRYGASGGSSAFAGSGGTAALGGSSATYSGAASLGGGSGGVAGTGNVHTTGPGGNGLIIIQW